MPPKDSKEEVKDPQKEKENHQNLSEKIARLRQRTIEERIWDSNEAKLVAFFKEIKNIKITKQLIQGSGIGFLLNDGQIWPERIKEEVEALVEAWRTAPSSNIMNIQNLPRPFRGMKSTRLLTVVGELANAMARVDESTASAVTYKMAAIGLANGGITCIQEMVGTVAMDFHLLQSNGAAISAAARISEKLNLEMLKKGRD